jgi:hypothetical protein
MFKDDCHDHIVCMVPLSIAVLLTDSWSFDDSAKLALTTRMLAVSVNVGSASNVPKTRKTLLALVLKIAAHPANTVPISVPPPISVPDVNEKLLVVGTYAARFLHRSNLAVAEVCCTAAMLRLP